MSAIKELYREFRHALETNPGPEDTLFQDVWDLYLDVTNLVSVRLMEPGMGGSTSGAHQVQWFLAWSEQTAKVCAGMPLRVPSPAVRTVKAAGRYLERTPHVDELGEFLRLAPPIVNDLSGYAAQQMGRHAKPVVDELSFAARAGSLMYESVARAVPGIEVAV